MRATRNPTAMPSLRLRAIFRDQPHDRADWCVFDGGRQPVGRIYEDQAAPIEKSRWFSALQIVGAIQAGVETSGRAATLDAAKAAFRALHERWQAGGK